MGCNVFANNNEIACKAGGGKVIASFPDVCLTPPSPPAGPVPVPYPNTSFSKDMQSGSKSVMIGGKEVMLKDKSFYKTSPLGDEAATKGLGAGVLTHVITGKTYFKMWSMDVLFEGENVDRHVDITTSNHACDPPNDAAPNVNTSTLAQMSDWKRDHKWGHKRTPKVCGGKHTWECNKKMCPKCWNPECKDNAEIEQKDYEDKQSGTNEERADKGKKDLADRAAKGETGAPFESAVIDKVGPDKVEHSSYYAHCSVCHTQAQLDIVTSDSVIECKASESLVDLKQMNERIKPVAEQCFPGRQVKYATKAADLAKLEKTLLEKEWAPLKLEAMDP